jgi:hypothetical protein
VVMGKSSSDIHGGRVVRGQDAAQAAVELGGSFSLPHRFTELQCLCAVRDHLRVAVEPDGKQKISQPFQEVNARLSLHPALVHQLEGSLPLCRRIVVGEDRLRDLASLQRVLDCLRNVSYWSR